jgi:hypothetical protein
LSATDDAGGIYFQGADGAILKITNCTFSGNSAVDDGGGLLYWESDETCTGTVYNSIFWGNSAVNGDEIEMRNNTDLSVNYSALSHIWNGDGGNNLIVADPLFEDAPNDYRLQCGSPCVNAGNDPDITPHTDLHDVDESGTTGETTPDRDLAIRIVGTTGTDHDVDMGAYEKQYTGCLGEANGILASHGVDVDDLLTVINSWGACNNCPADLQPHPCGNDIVDTDDLLEVINNWGNQCNGFTGSGGGSFSSVEDCMDAASLEYEAFSPEWDEFVEKCVNALCAAEILDCED